MISKRIVLVGCGKSKADVDTCPARALYTGGLFRASLAYAETLGADAVFIVSAQFYLLTLDEEVWPYDKTLRGRPRFDVLGWGENVTKRIENWADPAHHRCPWSYGKPNPRVRIDAILLAGETYANPIRAAFAKRAAWALNEPLAGLTLGRRLQWLSHARGELEAA